MICNKSFCALAVLVAALAVLQGCTDKTASAPPAPAASATQPAFAPITIVHKLGTTVIEQRPRRVAVLDMNEVDFLDQLGVPVAGMVKDYVPHFLTRYKDDQGIRDLGAIVQPNLEHIHALQPDLVLMTSIQANHYQELSQIAPTLHFDVDYQNSESKHIEVVKQHLLTLGRIFGKEDIASRKAQELDAKVADARKVTQDRPERALIVLHNNGAFSAFGVQSRYGFVFDALGVKPASTAVEAGLHGQPISSEFIQQANPDIIYVVDRTAVMEHRPVMTAEQMANPLLRQTNAWKNGRVVFVDADAWYITAASVTSLKRVIDDVLRGYQ
ncbi:siderophore ABC transporter substrate-binding protein [Janthinobacterium sp. SUN073]|uniref:siderophore ABC transporter substrate-binding protein n=1 Tax=Janthinobacterium sp. SUN073 TaxID=3004102 RepID=UPI0025B0FCD7|nr:siderophore ABC transporter substrate-binding protein [Janthinobacterium sp. SUN073]MDN2698899.1 siderophore ABC transporter substrate-binding protein [Janthinobacterium sp. SUN073]